MNNKIKTKAEIREDKKRKEKAKQKQNGTLAGQVLRTKSLKNYKGSVKKMIK